MAVEDVLMWQWALLAFAAFLMGFSKTAIGGTVLLVIPMFASVFGGKLSTGVMLPMLLLGDVYAVFIYVKYANKKTVMQLIPYTILGILAGAWLGTRMNDGEFFTMIGLSMLVCVLILTYNEIKRKDAEITYRKWFPIVIGFACGLTSMIGNASAPIYGIFLLALGYEKNLFMGTSALFFFLLNLMKMPFQIFVWHNISFETLIYLPYLLVPLIAGGLFGKWFLRRIDERVFRRLILAISAIASLKMLL